MIDRKIYLDSLINLKDKNLIKIITGIRRCGKSTLLELYQDYLLSTGVDKKQIISINLEDGDFRSIKNAKDLYNFIQFLHLYQIPNKINKNHHSNHLKT